MLIPTHIMTFILALGVGIKSFAQSTPVVLPSETPAEKKDEPKTETKFETKFEPMGDLRYRLAQSKEDIDEKRTFHQLRARLGVRATVEESLTLVLRLATATSAISSNQTLGDSSAPGMPRRSFGLDQAFSEFRFWEGTKIWAGRTANPFWAPAKNQMIYDSDLNFEGFAFKWEPKWGPVSPFLNIGAFIVNESYDKTGSAQGVDTADAGILGAQIGYAIHGFTFHLNHQAFANIQDRNITGIESGAKTDAYQGTQYLVYRGNSVYTKDLVPVATSPYLFKNKYLVSNAGFEYKTKFSDLEFMVFGDLISNSAVSSLGKGSELGVSFKYGKTSLQLAQIAKEADSTVGAFTDSDTNGGGTDGTGTRVVLGYQLTPKSQVVLNSFQAKRGKDTVTRDYSLTQLDLVASF
jgi:hypothetical protein